LPRCQLKLIVWTIRHWFGTTSQSGGNMSSSDADATGLSRGGSRSLLPTALAKLPDATGLPRGASRWLLQEMKAEMVVEHQVDYLKTTTPSCRLCRRFDLWSLQSL
jgi:hypothetical protein